MARAINRTVAVALATGLAFSGAVSTTALISAPAFAQTQQTIGTDGGTLTVHKFLNPDKITDSTQGQKATDLPQAGDPMPGAIFTATRINLDLKKPEEFEKAATLTPAQAASLLTSETYIQTTGDTGQAVFDLPLGAYLIRETPTDAQLNAGLVPAAPFIAYMPMTTPDGDTWNRDVHVYPKNTKLTTDERVDDANTHPVMDGEDGKVTYTIDATVPVLPQDRTLTSFNIVDTFNNAELTNPKVDSVKIGDTVLIEGVDYTVTTGTVTGPGDANASLTITLTPEGLKELTGGQTITVTLTGDVAQVGENGLKDGAVTNNSYTTGTTEVTGQPGEATTFTTPQDSVTSYFGQILVNKVDEATEPVKGSAVFDLYKVADQGDGVCNDLTGAQSVVKDFKVVDGTGVINALHVTDLQNDTAAIADTYCLIETQAPAGYLLDETPHAFTLTQAQATAPTTAGDYTLISQQITVKNRVQPPLTLPNTGGMGVALLILAGILIVGGGAYAARRNAA
ncbi:LPXTG-motif cell wall anchor domain-containing protein/fimbrial isopeptide formation D2 domain-containing protein [Corynebacterium mycetoides]|uniref:LPXTG-motif cell wall anchor domain-containing protein/fimbrial isopeptide formation D2 domain-containing protein n=1 Tax=Corynebacterium mycetoides TaxID=38302 RepID=A0A1G9Q0M1_9CORY|nr:SpaH/EbpB family LPXTG-anchored major pilin [Corynebacterium mycetoides]SDM04463.1 LPXTG-motif cell wall anchor domain-containing protein/fimbrial isopeptide formation D2 domain-containing protein [Corynebacterium mycetoides]